MLGLGGRGSPGLPSSGALPGALGVVGPPLSLDVLPPRPRGATSGSFSSLLTAQRLSTDQGPHPSPSWCLSWGLKPLAHVFGPLVQFRPSSVMG